MSKKSDLLRELKLPHMVRWFDVRLLARTGLYSVLSTLLGEMVDTRRILTGTGKEADCVFDYTIAPKANVDNEFWFDYMADTGDGWIATYTMAYTLSQPALNGVIGEPDALPRGQILVLGGDQVYPMASKKEYDRRLVSPFYEAKHTLQRSNSTRYTNREAPSNGPQLFAIPGNHDWYDGLDSFIHRFCSGSQLGIYQTRQLRSYFVLTLPDKWELWGIDLQLRHDLDLPQLSFFAQRARRLKEGTRIILCTAEPPWVFGAEAKNQDLRVNLNNLRRLIQKRGQGRVVLELAGDIHNYQRYEGSPDENGCQRCTVVSGGGGAFLHPNHGFAKEAGIRVSHEGLNPRTQYPSEQDSRRLAWKNLFFPLNNPHMVLMLGVAYLAMFGMLHPDRLSLAGVINYPLQHPWAAALTACFVTVFIYFADYANMLKRYLWGGLHALFQIGVGLSAVALAGRISARTTNSLGIDWPVLVHALSIIGIGGALGAFVFGIYLLVSLNGLGIHHSTAFSALRISNYKHFLRFKLSSEGLTVFVIGIDALPRRIRFRKGTADAPDVETKLIDTFTVC